MSEIVLKTIAILSNPLYTIVRISSLIFGIKYIDKGRQPTLIVQILAILIHFEGGRTLISFYCFI